MENIVIRNIRWILQSFKGITYKRNYNIWVMGEWFGKRCCDNCMYFANYVAQINPSIQLYWIAKENIDLNRLNKSIKFVKMDSDEATMLLHLAGVFIVNQGILDITEKNNYLCVGAVIVNLWHGIAWKRIGLDSMHGLKKIYYRHLMKMQRYTYFLAQSETQVDIMKSAYALNESQMLRLGSPRNCMFDNKIISDNMKKDLLTTIETKYGVSFENNVKIITYMPTFREYKNQMFSFYDIYDDNELRRILKQNNAIIIQKSHLAARKTKDENSEKIKNIYSLNDYPAQELLFVSDLLITDYSSCFFDFILLNRPVIHYLYDYDLYTKNDRGFYYDKEYVIAGDCVETKEDLVRKIEENLKHPEKNEELRRQRIEKYVTYEDLKSNEKLYDILMGKIKDECNI